MSQRYYRSGLGFVSDGPLATVQHGTTLQHRDPDTNRIMTVRRKMDSGLYEAYIWDPYTSRMLWVDVIYDPTRDKFVPLDDTESPKTPLRFSGCLVSLLTRPMLLTVPRPNSPPRLI